MGAILEIRNLGIALPQGSDRSHAVTDVNLSVARGEIVCLVGESGSGKSVIAHAVMGLSPKELKATSGEILLEGEDKPLLPATLEVLGPQSANLTITEGRYHQVRRMFAAVVNHVEALHRDRVGGLALPPDLAAGALRIMTPEDVAAVFSGPA